MSGCHTAISCLYCMRRTENFPKKMTLLDENDDCYLKIGIHIPSKLNKNSFMIFKGPLNVSFIGTYSVSNCRA